MEVEMKKLGFFAILILSISMAVLAQTETPKVKKYQAPTIPAAAKAVKASGTVRISVEIDDKGAVIRAVAKSGHPLLRAACIVAARGWIFSKAKGMTGSRMTDIVFEISYDGGRSKDKIKFEKPNILRVIVPELVFVP
jgi:TonB family protein